MLSLATCYRSSIRCRFLITANAPHPNTCAVSISRYRDLGLEHWLISHSDHSPKLRNSKPSADQSFNKFFDVVEIPLFNLHNIYLASSDPMDFDLVCPVNCDY